MDSDGYAGLRTAVTRCIIPLAIALFSAAAFGGGYKWTAIGPYGGQVFEFTFHPRLPSLIFARGYNGLYRSENTGKTWLRVLDLEPSAGWPGPRIHAKDDTTVIATATERLFKSTDLGSTWQSVYTTNFPGYATDIELHPTDPQILYAITLERGVYKSTDGGKSWVSKNSGLPSVWGYNKLEVDPSNGNTVFVLLAGGKGFKTTDGAESWQPAGGGLHLGEDVDLAIDPINPRVLYASGSRIYKTTNAGGAWKQIYGHYSYDLAIDAKSPQTLYSVGDPAMSMTTDAGETWTEILSVPQSLNSVAVHLLRSSHVFAGGASQGIFSSTNRGKSWKNVSEALDQLYVQRVAVAPMPAKRLFAVTWGFDLETSADDGKTWSRSAIFEQGAQSVLDLQVHPTKQGLVVAEVVGVSGGVTVALSQDGGENWSFGNTILDAPHSQYGMALHPRDQNVVYLAGWNGHSYGVAKTTDQGRTWRYVNTGLPSESEVRTLTTDPRNGSIVFAGTRRGEIFKTTDGGASWKNCNVGLGDWYINRISVDPTDPRMVYAATYAAIYKSSDSGNAWRDLEIPADTFVTLLPTTPQTIIAGGTGSLLVSTTGGAYWSRFDCSGLGRFAIRDFIVDPTKSSRFLIGTERGVFVYAPTTASGPVIQQLYPAYGKAGDVVTISGDRFGTSQGSSEVLFGSLETGTAQSWSEASIRVTAPSGVRTCDVTVRVKGRRSNPYEFIVLPTSGNLEPTSGPAAGGTRVTILAPRGTSGTQFNVLFGTAVAGDIRFIEPNIITCTSPPGTGTVEVKVTSSVTSTTVGSFTYQ